MRARSGFFIVDDAIWLGLAFGLLGTLGGAYIEAKNDSPIAKAMDVQIIVTKDCLESSKIMIK